MIQALQKRPFARPLLVWVAGIVWQIFFPVSPFVAGCLLLPALCVLFLSVLTAGKEVRFSFDARWLWGAVFVSLLLFLSIQKTARSQAAPMPAIVPTGIMQLAEETQQRLLEPIDKLRLTREEKSVLATLTLGARERMNREVSRRFSVTGVVHILSVSGFHVAIVCSFLSLLLSFLPQNEWGRWMRYGILVSLLWFFVFMIGLEAASIRSALMLTLYLTGNRLRRPTDSYNIWAASAFCMLVYDPIFLFDIGFQLSYLAVWSILCFQPRMQRLLWVRNPLLKSVWENITVTLSAQAGTTCLCLYYFGQFSTVFLLTNLPLTFLSAVLIPAGLLWMLLPEWIPGHMMLQTAIEWLTRALFGVVDAFSRVPGASIDVEFDIAALLATYSMMIFDLLYVSNKRKVWLVLLLLTWLFLPLYYLLGR